jgi:hypothetical protein
MRIGLYSLAAAGKAHGANLLEIGVMSWCADSVGLSPCVTPADFREEGGAFSNAKNCE